MSIKNPNLHYSPDPINKAIGGGPYNRGEPIPVEIRPNETGAELTEEKITRSLAEAEAARTPENANLIYVDKFKLVFKKLPNTQFFCSSANIPGMTIRVLNQATPQNNLNLGGNKVQYEPLTVVFRVDEDLQNYKEIKDWIEGIGAPKEPEQFINLIDKDKINRQGHYNIYSDATLLTLTNKYNYNIKIVYRDLFPTGLSSINFDNETNNATIASAQFVYKYYDILDDKGF